MFAIATAALIVLATTAQAATKYNYGGRDSYEPYEHRVYGREYKRSDPYESHYVEGDYRESRHDSYGGDAYSEEPIYNYEQSTKYRPMYKQFHEPQYRHKRSAEDDREGQQVCMRVCETNKNEDCVVECRKEGQGPSGKKEQGPSGKMEQGPSGMEEQRQGLSGNNIFTSREAQQFPSCIGKCIDQGPTGPQPACRDRSAAEGGRHFCYVSELCKDVKRSAISPQFLWSVDACCGLNNPC